MSETAVVRPEPPKAFRWAVLVLISLAMFGNYYVYDSISPLADVLKAQLGFSDANIGLLNAIYSFPNIVMVLIGGIIIDRIGTRRATLPLRRAVLRRRRAHRAQRDARGDGGRPPRVRPRRRVAHRRRHHRDREVVPRQGALVRLRREPDDRPARLLRRPQLPQLGGARLRELAVAARSSASASPPSA